MYQAKTEARNRKERWPKESGRDGIKKLSDETNSNVKRKKLPQKIDSMNDDINSDSEKRLGLKTKFAKVKHRKLPDDTDEDSMENYKISKSNCDQEKEIPSLNDNTDSSGESGDDAIEESGDDTIEESVSSKTIQESETSEVNDTERSADDFDEMKAVKEELSQMSFEELQQLKEKLGIKVFNQIMYGKNPDPIKTKPPKVREPRKTEFKRSDKKSPMEVTSKKKVSRNRTLIPYKKKVVRDPRFDEQSGEFNDEYFQKSYSFLTDVKTREKQKLQKQLRKAKDGETKSKIKAVLNRITQQEKTEQIKLKKSEQEKEWWKKEKELVAQGKKPFYLKKSDKKKLELADKYRELQSAGKLEKYLSKKRKKNSQKQRKRITN